MENHSEEYKNNYYHQIIFDIRKKKYLKQNKNKKKIILSPEDFIDKNKSKKEIIPIT